VWPGINDHERYFSVDLPQFFYWGLAMSDANHTPSFEAKLAELEALVRQMEQGSMPLDTSLDAFEKGIQLAKECHAILDSASQKVTEIKQSGEQAPFDPEA
jgi:exodeoxyribonuclease VII small subunit